MTTTEGTMPDAADQAEVIAQEMLRRLEQLGTGNLRGEISLAQYRMLAVVQKLGPVSIGRIGNIVGAAQSTTSEMMTRLLKAGLVTKVRSTQDNRVVTVEVTDQGRQVFKRSRKRIREAYQGLHDKLSPSERDLLLRALQQLDVLLRKAGA